MAELKKKVLPLTPAETKVRFGCIAALFDRVGAEADGFVIISPTAVKEAPNCMHFLLLLGLTLCPCAVDALGRPVAAESKRGGPLLPREKG